MNKLTIYYSIVNGGDGSAYPIFMESEELAKWDQDNMDEGWGEPCNGSLSFESESEITFLKEIVTKESYFIDTYVAGFQPNPKEIKKFISKFFPEGLPYFTVSAEQDSGEDYIYNYVYVKGKQVAKVFRGVETSGEFFEGEINRFEHVNNFALKQEELNEDED